MEPCSVTGKIALRFTDGSRVIVDADAVSLCRTEDGSYTSRLSFGSLVGVAAGAATVDEPGDITLPIVQEVVHVGRRKSETGRVRVQKTVQDYEQAVDVPLAIEGVEVERVPVNRVVDPVQAPRMREEGDTLVIPVLEEKLVVEKKLFIREEVRIKRTRREERRRESIALRREHVAVDRAASSTQLSVTPGETDQPTGSAQTTAGKPIGD